MTQNKGLIVSKKKLYIIKVSIAAAALYAISLFSYPFFNSIAELSSIVICAVIFVIAWNARNFLPEPYFLFVGISYLYVASTDLIHLLDYKDMGIFAGSEANLSMQLWIGGRYMQSISLLAAPYFIGRKLKIIPVFILYFLASAGLLFSVYYGLFPEAFIEGKGLTPFKIISEYIISLILVLAIIYLRKKRENFDKLALNLLIWSLIITIVSEMAFTLDKGVDGFFSTFGNFFKIASFYLIYAAIIKTILRKPYEELYVSEFRYRQLFEAAKDGIIILDAETGIIQDVNPFLVGLLGFSREELIGKHIWEPRFSRNIVANKANFLELQQKESPRNEGWLETADGRRVEVESIRNVYHLGQNKVIQCNIRDITKRKQAEEALRVSDETLKTVFDNAMDGILLADIETKKFLRGNRMICEMLGLNEEEINHMSVMDIHPENDLLYVIKQFEKQTRREIRLAKDIPIKRKDGSIFYADVNSSPVTIGGKTYLLGIFRDITERKQAEEVLRGKAETIQTLIQISPLAIIATDPQGYVTLWNPSAEAIFGWSSDEVIGKQNPIIPPDKHGEVLHVRQHVLNDESFVDFETQRIRKDGTRIIISSSVTSFKQAETQTKGILSFITDITERKTLEEQLRQAQKMEAVGQLAGGVAHDFNNILSAIIGYGHMALMKMAQDDPQRLNIENMLEATDRAAHLTKELLLFSRKQISERRMVDLNEIIRKVEKFLKRIIGEDIEFKTMLQGQPITALADSNQIEQVLMNLATNAYDAMTHGGDFTITTEKVYLNEDFIANDCGNPGHYALITVSDTGRGMDEETLKHVFEPFFTTKEVGKGTGLGLAVVYGIIKQHGGCINIYSEQGKGTTFRIYLPLILSEAKEDAKIHKKEEAIISGTETVLIAEDDEALRKLSSTVLKQFGYSVIEAVDGEDVVRKFMENKYRIHLLLLDLIMPKMNGKEAYNEIRKIKPCIKVIFASGYAPDIVRQKASLENDAHLIYKPISPFELLRKVRNVLDGEQHNR